MCYGLQIDALRTLSPVEDLNLNVDVLSILIVWNVWINLRNVRITRTANFVDSEVVPVVTEYSVTAEPIQVISIICTITSIPRRQVVTEVLDACNIIAFTILVGLDTYTISLVKAEFVVELID